MTKSLHRGSLADTNMKTNILIGSKTYPVDMLGSGELPHLGVSKYSVFNNLDVHASPSKSHFSGQIE